MRVSRVVVMSTLAALVGCVSENRFVDPGDAELTLEDPEPAAWFDLGTVTATGDWSGLSEIAVNGVDASTTGTLSGSFSADIELGRGITVVTASGVDGGGDTHFVKHHVIAGAFENPLNAVDEAAIVRINEGGLDTILDAVGEEFDSGTVMGMLANANPVYTGTFLEVAGEDVFAVDLFVDDFDFSWMDLAAEPGDDVLSFTASLYNLDIATSFEIAILGGSWFDPIEITLYADRVDVTGDVAIGAYQGELDVVILDSSVDMAGFFFDTSVIPTGIEGALLSSTVQDVLEARLGGILEERVADMLQEQLAAFDMSFETELLGKLVTVDAAFADASIDPAGVELVMDIDADIAGDNGLPYRGFLTAPGDPPTPDATADISLSLWDDLLNKILFEAWRGGLLDMTLSTDDGSLEPIMLAPLHADAGTIDIEALLPPVVVEAEGGLQAQLGEVGVTIDMEGSDLGSYIEIALAVVVDLDLRVRNEELAIVLGTPELDIMVRDSDWGASNEATSNLLGEVLPIDLLLGLLGDLSFPLPDLLGLELDATAGRDLNGTHTSVRVDLSLAD